VNKPLSEITFGIDLATLIIVLSSAVYSIYFWNKKREEKKEYERIMDDPIDFRFFIPHKDLGITLKYYKQDNEDHETDELALPPNFEDQILILIRPKLNLLLKSGIVVSERLTEVATTFILQSICCGKLCLSKSSVVC
jgi:hypothetical protein